MKKVKIVFIGAGSLCFGQGTFKDIFSTQEMKGSTLCLVDTNKENLERMVSLTHIMNKESGLGLKIESTSDRRAVLPGADFVICGIDIDRIRLWKLDFEIPRKHGIRHTMGENGGPGGLFHGLRVIPIIMGIARDMEELCPNAYFINFSNPESRIILALGRYTKIRCLGLCHGISMSRKDIAKILDCPRERLELRAAGLNHFQWILDILDKETGENLNLLFKEKEKKFDPSFNPLTRRMYRAFGKYPTCSEDHMGEYLPYGYEGGEEGHDFVGDEKWRVETTASIDSINAGKPLAKDFFSKPSGEKELEVIMGIMYNRKTFIESGIIYNQGAIPNLPAEAGVEVPVIADASGIHPVSLGPLPDGIAKLLNIQALVQQMAVEAAVRGSKELALQALLIDPVMNSASAAEKILEELWEVNKKYIRNCI